MKSIVFAISMMMVSIVNKPTLTNSHSKNIQMKQYSLLVRVPLDYSTEKAKSVNPAWDRLLQEWRDEQVYVLSFAFPGESYTVSGKDKVEKKESVVAGNLRVVSNLVLQAESMEKAIALAKRVPILEFGGSVEVREIPKPLQVTPAQP